MSHSLAGKVFKTDSCTLKSDRLCALWTSGSRNSGEVWCFNEDHQASTEGNWPE
ncbi:hypothetical protein ILYODFUR_020229, partial [Ilyodon furcidens]